MRVFRWKDLTNVMERGESILSNSKLKVREDIFNFIQLERGRFFFKKRTGSLGESTTC